MDSTAHSASDSKVIVECTDPSNIFDSVRPLLAERLPLRDLNWKSPSRPLRSINSLHVELTRAKPRSVGAPDENGLSRRRHQIPGLQQTPYVKIYLLRCDDNETYKATSRKAIREWVKSTSASSEEGYDACEWLILHVVLPDTSAATQPPTSSRRNSDGPSDSTDSISGKSKWGRSSSTIFEKLRADFNSSSKGGLDRVAQIRLAKDDSKQSISAIGLTPSELESLWQDLMEKLKIGVLTSFDLRVLQYEEEIREKDSQRSLPGWNFCTFFILKEGLAKGFEDVGLYEDALIGYEELAYGLDVIIREQSQGEADEHGGILALSTDDLHTKLQALLETSNASTDGLKQRTSNRRSLAFNLPAEDFALDPTSKPFRDLILANKISIFDFRVYIFSRQLTLLLKAARSPATSKHSADENFLLLAEVCHRATEFTGTGSRTLRADLQQGLENATPAQPSHELAHTIIENMVSSWIYRVCLQILTQTSSSALVIPAFGVTGSGEREKSALESSPALGSSLSPGSPVGSDSRSMRRASVRSVSARQSAQSAQALATAKTGADELASARGELYVLARRVLQALGATQGWTIDWTNCGILEGNNLSDTKDMDDVSLDGAAAETPFPYQNKHPFTAIGLEPLQLKDGASHENQFFQLFEGLTDHAYRHFVAGNKLKSAESMVADVALQKYRSEEYDTAASLFRRLSTFYESGAWPTLSVTLLDLYAKCLKRLNNLDEYLNILVQLLSLRCRGQRSFEPTQYDNGISYYWDELLQTSEKLSRQVTIPFGRFFSLSEGPLYIQHREHSDGFLLPMKIRSLLRKSMQIADGISITLKNSTDLYAPSLVLQTTAPVTVGELASTIVLQSNVTVAGRYLLDELSFKIGHLTFTHDFRTATKASSSELGLDPEEDGRPSVVIFPASQALGAKIRPRKHIRLGDRPHLEVELHNGWNHVEECIIKLKPATAGMRLRVNEATVLSNDGRNVRIMEEEGSHTIHLEGSEPNSEITLSVPYTLENMEILQLETRLEVIYKTSQGNFTLLDVGALNAILPITVNVQDLFKSNMLLSRFTVGSATLVPLRLLDCQIEGNSAIDVKSGMQAPLAMDISPKQPTSLVYMFTPIGDHQRSNDIEKLMLKAEYVCLDEQALDTLEQTFRSDLLSSPVSALTRLLLTHFIDVFRTHWTANDLEAVSMLRAVRTWPYADFGWDGLLASVDGEYQTRAKAWLKEWHSKHLSIPLLEAILGSDLNRRIEINVELPKPSVIVTASLQVSGRPSSELPVGVGQPLAAELRISFVHRWGPSQVGEKLSIEISYEIATTSDTWLVGGRRRGNVVCQPRQEQVFMLMLLPQRPGHLLLPLLDIKCFKIEDEEGGELSPSKKTNIDFEVDYQSLAKSILVIPDLNETTHALDGDGAGRLEWLVNSKRRSERI